MSDGNTNAMVEWLQDWWHFVIAVATGALGLWVGAERTKWKLSQLVNDFDKQELRQKNTEDRLRVLETSIARIEAGREAHDKAVLQALVDIKQQLHDKADKK